MPSKKGRPPIENPKTIRIEIRMTEQQANTLTECAELLRTTKTAVINKGIEMVKAELEKK